MKKNNFLAVLPSDDKWLTGGIFYDYELMSVLGITNIFKITSSRKNDYIGIFNFFKKNIVKDKVNIVVIDAASIIYLLPIIILKKYYNFKLITLHMHLQGKENSLKQDFFKWAIINLSNKIITISEYSNRELFPKKADLIIYPPLRIIEKKPIAASNSKKISILFVGSIIRRKNIQFLIELMDVLDDRFELVICGNISDDVYYNELTFLINKYNVEGRVIFTGKVSDEELAMQYNLADIFIFPSILEGFGMVNIEAMYLGIPVFASDVGPHREIIDDNIDGFLFDVNNIILLKNRINNFVSDPQLKEKISINAKKKAESFIWYKNKILKEFDNMIDHKEINC